MLATFALGYFISDILSPFLLQTLQLLPFLQLAFAIPCYWKGPKRKKDISQSGALLGHVCNHVESWMTGTTSQSMTILELLFVDLTQANPLPTAALHVPPSTI